MRREGEGMDLVGSEEGCRLCWLCVWVVDLCIEYDRGLVEGRLEIQIRR